MQDDHAEGIEDKKLVVIEVGAGGPFSVKPLNIDPV